MLIHEALGYNRFGHRYVSREEMDARKRFLISHSEKDAKFQKPLSDYQDGKRSFPELVVARHKDRLSCLSEEYQDFFKFPQSRKFQEYQQKKQEIEKDYDKQKVWLDYYHYSDKRKFNISLDRVRFLGLGGLCLSAGVIMTTCANTSSLIPLASMASLYYIGAVISFYNAHCASRELKVNDKDKERVKIILEDWYQADPFARYDRLNLNEKLQALNKNRPTLKRRDQKRILVASYRSNHPRVRV